MNLIRILVTTLISATLLSTAAHPSEGQEKIRPGHGDQVPGLAMTEIFEGKAMTLESFSGKYVYLDFWATWCPPCQDVMKHLNETGPEIQKQWPDQIVIMGVSTDKTAKKAKKHCSKRGWTKILQTHASDTKAFNFDGIPTAFLIGPDRKIIWRGHPAEFKLKEVLEKMIGPGIPQAPSEKAPDVKPSAAPMAAIDTAGKPVVARKRPVDSALPIVDDAAIMDTIKREADKLGDAKGIPTTSVLRQQLQARKSCKPFATPALPADPADHLYARTGKSVLVIAHVGKCDDCDDWHVNCGSGFVVSNTGIAATNYHVMNDQEGSFVVAVNRDLDAFPITAVLAADVEADCALVQLGDGSRNDFTPLPLATSATIGAPVTVISHPDDNFFVMTRGVAARYAYTEESSTLPWLCITAEYAKGSSGAPVFNDRGQVVGMVSSTQSIYYSENGKRQNDLQMVMRYCVPSSAIQSLSKP